MAHRTPADILDEVATALVLADPSDPEPYREAQALVEALVRVLPASAVAAIAPFVEAFRVAIVDLLEGGADGAPEAEEAVSGAIKEMQHVLLQPGVIPPRAPECEEPGASEAGPQEKGEGAASQGNAEAPDRPAVTPPRPPAATGCASVERDEEEVVLIGEFLQESTEGLTTADQLLMDTEELGQDDERVNGLFRVFHTIKGVAGFLELRDIASLAHTTETMLNQVREGRLELAGGVLDLTFSATEMMRRMLGGVRDAVEAGAAVPPTPEVGPLLDTIRTVVEGQPAPADPVPVAKPGSMIGEILERTTRLPPAELQAALAAQKETGRRLGEELVARGSVTPKEVAHAIRAQKAASQAKLRETIKVDLERVDRLVETIGELVIVESMVVNAPEISSLTSTRVRNYLGQLSKITRDLQDLGMRMRMVPVRGLFQKMARMVRDLSHKSGKRVAMVQSGEGTEMDRSMVELLADPLVHMIRNAVDHGVEPSAERVAAGKSDRGTVSLSAYHEGGSIVVEVSDDGRGLHREKILAKAVAQGLVPEGATLTDSEVFELVFAPGFSTAAQVTEISGRGVGMDVVRKNIEAMRGRILVESTPGHGSSFKMILPLTLAIIDGMLVACGAESYIIPTLSIVESIQPERSMLMTYANGKELIDVRGEIMPLFALGRLLGIRGAKTDPTEALVVVVESLGRRVGLLVDDVVTQQQVVIKTLGTGIGKTDVFSGAAILSDGRVGLIIDVEALGNLASSARSDGANGGGRARAEAARAAWA